MDKKLVSLTRSLVEAIEGIHVSLPPPLPLALSHGNTFAARKTNVIAPLLFHIREQRLFVGPYIQHPLVANMAGVGNGPKAAFFERVQPTLVAIPYTLFDFEHECAAVAVL